MENIQFMYITKDGVHHPCNIAGACNVIDAAFELASSILNGDLEIDPNEIVGIIDKEG